MRREPLLLLILLLPILLFCLSSGGAAPQKRSVFFPADAVQRLRANVQRHAWAKTFRNQVVAKAELWRRRSDEDLWGLMFGNSIKRAWQVWSNGHCPACKQSVPMYEWRMDALNHPWKTRCPHCEELFPKNDFEKFYRSGLNAEGVFDPQKADRSLLFNAGHPDPNDPLHRFGVDDGEGYAEGANRWRFIGAYLIYGQWKQAIVAGIRALAAAYVLTGDAAYAHKAGVLLDRVADLYPTMDFGKEGVMYEGAPRSGYVSTWHDACEETRELALAYDMVRDALSRDTELAAFLGRQAARFRAPSPKKSPDDVLRNIESRILRDALNSPDKIYSNYPRTEYAVAIMQTVLDWPQNRAETLEYIGKMLDSATRIDGVTGEKGLTGYSAAPIQGLAEFLSLYSRIEPGLLREMFRKQPALRQTWRFFLDTWCLQQYYPRIGDTGAFAQPMPAFVGVGPVRRADALNDTFGFSLPSSMATFLWNLYEITGDAAYVQTMVHGNGGRFEGLPYDLFGEDSQQFQQKAREVIARAGRELRLGSVVKPEWHLAILRSGKGKNQRALWLDFDSGGYHGHADGMNLGLFAFGLDILPDFGYPPVQFGGWSAPKSRWYMMSAAHNTVVVDGKNHRSQAGARAEIAGFAGLPAGKITLWADGQRFHAARASGPEMISGRQFERAAALVDISDSAFYVFDLFRVVGGQEHAKFLRSGFGALATEGLALRPIADYGHETQMRGFRGDASPAPGWRAEWKIEDRLRLLPPGADARLRVHDLTSGAQAAVAESWIAPAGYQDPSGAWIPTLMVRRQAASGELASTFVSLLEPRNGGAPRIASARRLPLQTPAGAAYPDSCAAVEARLADGSRDLILAGDVENPQGRRPSLAADKILAQPDWNVECEGELAFIRRNAAGVVTRLVLCRGRFLRVGDLTLRLRRKAEAVEIALEKNRARVVSGDPRHIEALTLRGKRLLPTTP